MLLSEKISRFVLRLIWAMLGIVVSLPIILQCTAMGMFFYLAGSYKQGYDPWEMLLLSSKSTTSLIAPITVTVFLAYWLCVVALSIQLVLRRTLNVFCMAFCVTTFVAVLALSYPWKSGPSDFGLSLELLLLHFVYLASIIAARINKKWAVP